MRKTDEGEFELVLGNKQLLSVFFIVVVLLGVFFTMGYIVGRNTAGDTLDVAQAPGQPLVVDSGSSRPAPAATPAPPPADPPPVVTRPAPEPPKQQPPAPVKLPTPPPAKAVPTPAPKPAPPVPSPSPSPAGVSLPPTGQVFLQVAATSATEGAVLRDVLRKRGFQAQLAPVPGQDMVRVLVGPLADNQETAQTRTKLQEAGFKPFTRKY